MADLLDNVEAGEYYNGARWESRIKIGEIKLGGSYYASASQILDSAAIFSPFQGADARQPVLSLIGDFLIQRLHSGNEPIALIVEPCR
jgi:hypothetical protein